MHETFVATLGENVVSVEDWKVCIVRAYIIIIIIIGDLKPKGQIDVNSSRLPVYEVLKL